MRGMRRLCSALLFVVSERIVLNLLRYEGWNYKMLQNDDRLLCIAFCVSFS